MMAGKSSMDVVDFFNQYLPNVPIGYSNICPTYMQTTLNESSANIKQKMNKDGLQSSKMVILYSYVNLPEGITRILYSIIFPSYSHV